MKYYETYQYDLSGYQKLFHSQNWRIAILNHTNELEIENINYVECHLNTDEVFVLLNGSCTMIFAKIENDGIIGYEKVDLQMYQIYKILPSVYHTHVLSKDAKLLIIEAEDTTYENSPRHYFSVNEKQKLMNLIRGDKNNGI
jgi:hypothetical protein